MKATCMECGESYEGEYPDPVDDLTEHMQEEHGAELPEEA